MNSNLLKPISLILILFTCFVNIYGQGNKQQINNLRAFAKLYGYVRFFHPSDESANLDWDKFSIYGSEKVLAAKNEKELKDILKKLFLPIAPTAQIYSINEKPIGNKKIIPPDILKYKVASWQHYGVKLPYEFDYYKSIRLNCKNADYEKKNYGSILQTINILPYRGKELSLSAQIKTDIKDASGGAALGIEILKGDYITVYSNDMADKPIVSPEWKEYTVTFKVPENTPYMCIRCIMRGIGKVWFDDIKLSYKNEKNEWIPIEILNPGFELKQMGKEVPSWESENNNFQYKLEKEIVKSGTASYQISNETLPGTIKKLFEQEAKAGQVTERKISEEIICRVPLTLYCDSTGTYGKNKEYPISFITAELDKIKLDTLKGDNQFVRLGNIINAWNVFQHFYPYFDVVKVDWDKALTETLKESILDKNSDDHYKTLMKMVAKLQDGHGLIIYQPVKPQGDLPLKAKWIEDKVVIVASSDTVFKKGDIIKTIDGKSSENIIVKNIEYASGSPQVRRIKAINQLGQGDVGSIADVEILRGGKTINIKLERKLLGLKKTFTNEFSLPLIKKLDNDIYYVNLYIPQKDFDENLEELSKAKGIIFDWRFSNQYQPRKGIVKYLDVVLHIADKDVKTAILNMPQVIFPDREEMKYVNEEWSASPEQPHFAGKIVFIINPDVMSTGETSMGIVENYKLAETVGESTAGTNGTTNFIRLPGGYRIMWTDMQVLKHDGSQHHLIGIQPNYPVKRTIKAVIEERDEYLEKAIEVLKKSIK